MPASPVCDLIVVAPLCFIWTQSITFYQQLTNYSKPVLQESGCVWKSGVEAMPLRIFIQLFLNRPITYRSTVSLHVGLYSFQDSQLIWRRVKYSVEKNVYGSRVAGAYRLLFMLIFSNVHALSNMSVFMQNQYDVYSSVKFSSFYYFAMNLKKITEVLRACLYIFKNSSDAWSTVEDSVRWQIWQSGRCSFIGRISDKKWTNWKYRGDSVDRWSDS